MKLLQRYLLQQFIPICFFALLFFILLLELGDLFANLWRYLANEAPIRSVITVMILYIPKCISYSMPMAVLFASAYTMGSMYARNELTSVFAAGYPLYKLIIPLLVLGLLLSFGMFFFEDRVVIHSLAQKNALNRVLLNQQESLNNGNVVVISESRKVVYTADFYQAGDKKLYSLIVVIRTEDGDLEAVIQAPSGKWSGSEWVLETPITYIIKDDVLVEEDIVPYELTESPEIFQRNVTSVDELSAEEAKVYIENARRAGLPYAEMLSNYYRRFSFPFTIFIVLFFSISLGGRFKKNILLMSLLLSLSIAVLYYVMQMITMILAKWEYISPLAGAWVPVIFFSEPVLRFLG
ncbi:LptF/LptG family permease [Brucepastera parasyntrophica]|uniref:LptF/LptG family permease n=1 Tax=Brucepastera parasyntrophica TaxID=2880008 RepID=UPI00210BD82B|nr:LptF/LptG family permease [Brucepastera parasyntrophica]ULQ60118.1 LptF/LptG family permease [Brucepastera parasyntrophica]